MQTWINGDPPLPYLCSVLHIVAARALWPGGGFWTDGCFSFLRVLCPSSPAWTALLWRRQWWVMLNVLIKLRPMWIPDSWSLLLSFACKQVQFDRYLSSPDTLVMPQLNFLLSAAIKWVSVRNVDRCFSVHTENSIHAIFRPQIKCLPKSPGVITEWRALFWVNKNRTGAST